MKLESTTWILIALGAVLAFILLRPAVAKASGGSGTTVYRQVRPGALVQFRDGHAVNILAEQTVELRETGNPATTIYAISYPDIDDAWVEFSNGKVTVHPSS